MSVDHGVYNSPESERPVFLDVAPGMTVIVQHDLQIGEKRDKDWWMGEVIHCGGGAGEPESAATVMRLMLAHMVVLNKRVMSAMVLDRLDAEISLSTPFSTPDRCQHFVNGANSVNGTDC